MTTTGKTVVAITVLVLLIAAGLTYYLYSDSKIEEVANTQAEYSNTLSNVSTALSRDQIKAESFDQSLAAFEADLENESNGELYDENKYVENSNINSELNIQY